MPRVSLSLLCVCTLSQVSCTHVIGDVPVDSGHRLQIEAYGTSATIESKCLSLDAVRQLTGSEIASTDLPDPPPNCVRVIIASSSSSSISKAITEYANSEAELSNLATSGGPRAANPSSAVRFAIDAVAAIKGDEATLSKEVVIKRTQALVPLLTGDERKALRSQLALETANVKPALTDTHKAVIQVVEAQ